jgi:homoserine dehydrogenase
MNAVLVQGDAVGPTLYYGPGAGSEPTASSVIADVVDVVRTLDTCADSRVPSLSFQSQKTAGLEPVSSEEFVSAYYLRMEAEDEPGVMAEVATILGRLGISIEAILQKEPVDGSLVVPVILLTRRVREGLINQGIAQIESLSSIKKPLSRIRVESLG